jgi:hypothetical protein
MERDGTAGDASLTAESDESDSEVLYANGKSPDGSKGRNYVVTQMYICNKRCEVGVQHRVLAMLQSWDCQCPAVSSWVDIYPKEEELVIERGISA